MASIPPTLTFKEIQISDNLDLFPNSKRIEEIIKQKVIDNSLQCLIHQYYIRLLSLRNIHLIISFCFNGSQMVANMKKINQSLPQSDKCQIDESSLNKLNQVIQDQFTWTNNIDPVNIFHDNFLTIQKDEFFKFFAEIIFPKINSNFAQKLFLSTIQTSKHMYGIKIRWINKQMKMKKEYFRNYQKLENEEAFGATYLVIIQEKSTYIGSVFSTKNRHDTVYTQTEKGEEIEKEEEPQKKSNYNNIKKSNYHDKKMKEEANNNKIGQNDLKETILVDEKINNQNCRKSQKNLFQNQRDNFEEIEEKSICCCKII